MKHRRASGYLLRSAGLFFVLFCGASLEVLVPSSVCCLEGHRGSALGWRRNGRERQVIQISSSFSELFVNCKVWTTDFGFLQLLQSG